MILKANRNLKLIKDINHHIVVYDINSVFVRGQQRGSVIKNAGSYVSTKSKQQGIRISVDIGIGIGIQNFLIVWKPFETFNFYQLMKL